MENELTPSDLYVHVADDGGVLALGPATDGSAWVTGEDLHHRIDKTREAGGHLYISSEQGSAIGAKTIQVLMDSGLPVTTGVEPLPETRRPGGATSLMAAAAVGSTALVADLIRRGVDLEQRNDVTRTALMTAAEHGQAETLEQLLVAGAEVDKTEQLGNTALGIAAIFGQAQVVPPLLAAGADPTHRNEGGKTPRAIAEIKGFERVANLLPPGSGASAAAHPTGTATQAPGSTEPSAGTQPSRLFGVRPDRGMGTTFLVIGLVFAALAVVAGVGSGPAGAAVLGILALIELALGGYLFSRLIEIDGHRLRTRSLGRTSEWLELAEVKAVDLRAVSYWGRRVGMTLRLLNTSQGSKALGAKRWNGPYPEQDPASPLRFLRLPTSRAAGNQVVSRVAGPLLASGALMNQRTRSFLQAGAGSPR